MGNSHLNFNKINHDDVIYAIGNKYNHVIINTLPLQRQQCLISGTCVASEETDFLNKLLDSKRDINIIIYGENSNDNSVYNKYDQLIKLGFTNIYIYSGGIFEWLLLQDIFGEDLFPTTTIELDILKYKSAKKLDIKYIEN